MSTLSKFRFALLCLVIVGLSSCDNTTIADVQLIKDVIWRPDGQNLLALAERTSYATATSGGTDAYDLYKVNSDGSFAEKIGLPSPVYYANYFLGILQSVDGASVLVQSATNVVRADILQNSSKVVLQDMFLLGASPDLKYAIATSDPGYLNKTFSVYDISVLPARRVSQFNAINSTNNRVLWIGDGLFAVTHIDSNQIDYLTLYDTLGVAQRSIENARLAYHASAYAADSKQLFALDRLNHLVRIDLATGERHTVTPTTDVQSADVSSDGALAAYTTTDTNNTRYLKIVNVATGDQLDVASDALIVAINPVGNKLAYIKYNGPYAHEIKVQNVNLP